MSKNNLKQKACYDSRNAVDKQENIGIQNKLLDKRGD